LFRLLGDYRFWVEFGRPASFGGVIFRGIIAKAEVAAWSADPGETAHSRLGSPFRECSDRSQKTPSDGRGS
jgi:hypothetical protein